MHSDKRCTPIPKHPNTYSQDTLLPCQITYCQPPVAGKNQGLCIYKRGLFFQYSLCVVLRHTVKPYRPHPTTLIIFALHTNSSQTSIITQRLQHPPSMTPTAHITPLQGESLISLKTTTTVHYFHSHFTSVEHLIHPLSSSHCSTLLHTPIKTLTVTSI